jgi:hypothetical protein
MYYNCAAFFYVHENCVMPTLLIMKGKQVVGRMWRPVLSVARGKDFFGFVKQPVKCSLSLLNSSNPQNKR